MRKIFWLFLSFLFILSCSSKEGNENNETDGTIPKKHIEILYFYEESDGPESKAINQQISNLLDSAFKKEISDKTIEYKKYNLSTAEGKEVAKNYNVKKTALFVNNFIGEKEIKKNMSLFAWMNAASDPQLFKDEIKTLLEIYLVSKPDTAIYKAPDFKKEKKIVGGKVNE